MSEPSILLLAMPFASPDTPVLSIATLQAHLRRAGLRCDARYPCLELAARLPTGIQHLGTGGPMAGEWLFAPALHGEPLVEDDLERYLAYAAPILGDSLTDDLVAELVAARAVCTAFVDELASAVDWSCYDAVGFSAVFQQTLASLALATRIRADHPELPLVFGGANFHGEMGVALHQTYDVVDVACTGEGDDLVVELFANLAAGLPVDHLPGIVHRRDGASIANPAAPLVTDLDALPVPDFDDWFAQRAAAGFGGERAVTVELSRGCWWGAISHCTFCGLNGDSMTYRSKSADRAYDEITGLRARHRADFVTVADNIMDMRYLRTLLPRLAERDDAIPLFFEIRPKLNRDQVARLAAAGAEEVLPGIESLSDHSLDLMGKATTGLEGVKLLKHCAEFGLAVNWNYLYGTPGETAADHRAAVPLVRASLHLAAPRGLIPVQIHRFSPLHLRSDELGFRNVRAESVYGLLHPVDQGVLDRIAYVFEGDHAPGTEEALDVGELRPLVERWMAGGGQGGLWELEDEGSDDLWIVDERPWTPAVPPIRLTGWRAEVYARCDKVATRSDLVAVAGEHEIDEAKLDTFLHWAAARELLAVDGERYLSVAVHHPPRWPRATPSPAERRPIPVVAS